MGLLPEYSWKSHYDLTYSIYREALECEYLNLNFSEAEKIFNIVIKNVKSNIDKANVHTLMILLYTTQGNYEDALRVGIEGMKMLGISLPKNVSDARVGLEMLKLRLKFGRRKIEDLIDLQYFPYRIIWMKQSSSPPNIWPSIRQNLSIIPNWSFGKCYHTRIWPFIPARWRFMPIRIYLPI